MAAKRAGKASASGRKAKATKARSPKAATKRSVPRRPAITPFLWFDDDLEDAVAFYKTVFPDVKMWGVTRYGEAGPGPKGKVMSASFSIAGQTFGAVNGGPVFQFNESVSFVIDCKDQAEIDHYWSKLTANGGQESQCGWLKDPFGVSWQVVPTRLAKMLADPDPAKAGRAMRAMLQMRKLDLATLEAAYRGR